MQGRRNHSVSLLVLTLLLLVFPALYPRTAAGEKPTTSPVAATYTYKVISPYPHDPEAFTQGLVIDNETLYESTGRYGLSSLRRVDMLTGEATKVLTLPREYFGEGITVFGDKIIQLTWKSNIVIVYDKISFERINSIAYPFEGWGITHDGSQLIVSDGTATIRFLDPSSLEVKRRVKVMDGKSPVRRLNELEFINGSIYANVWQSDRIAIIDPEDGRVQGWLDLSGLLGREGAGRQVDVLNGIAYDPMKNLLYVTGKLWPRLFAIQPVFVQEK